MKLDPQDSAGEQIKKAVGSWQGVTLHDHRFGGIEFRVSGREMGHLHGDALADLPFPKSVSEKLIMEGKAGKHHFVPQSGWVSCRIDGTPEAISNAIELFRMQYDRLSAVSPKK